MQGPVGSMEGPLWLADVQGCGLCRSLPGLGGQDPCEGGKLCDACWASILLFFGCWWFLFWVHVLKHEPCMQSRHDRPEQGMVRV